MTRTRLQQRRLLPEVMDQPGISPKSHWHALAGLGRINRFSRTAAILWKRLRPLAIGLGRPLRVLDVACGGGDVVWGLWHRAQRDRTKVDLLGVDISPTAVQYARQRTGQTEELVRFETLDVLQDPLPQGFDATICSLFLHHLDQRSATQLVSQMAATCSQLLLVSDLRRSRRGHLLAHLACRALTTSPIVHVDGPRSVAAAFQEPELAEIFHAAALHNFRIERKWPFRLLASWSRS
jgi:SAM-dependent methyltransferase